MLIKENIKICKPQDMVRTLTTLGINWEVENFITVCLSNKNHIKFIDLTHIGGITKCLIDIRVIFKSVLLSGSPNFIVAHNHPSGDVEPSKEDKEITKKIEAASEIMGFNFLDHIIFTQKENIFYNFKE